VARGKAFADDTIGLFVQTGLRKASVAVMQTMHAQVLVKTGTKGDDAQQFAYRRASRAALQGRCLVTAHSGSTVAPVAHLRLTWWHASRYSRRCSVPLRLAVLRFANRHTWWQPVRQWAHRKSPQLRPLQV
jgi:hypothetical protein